MPDDANPLISKLAEHPGFLDLTKAGKPPKVMIATPSGGSSRDAYTESMYALLGYSNPDKIHVFRKMCRGSNIAENQNTLVDLAREREMDYILFVENDVAFPKHGLEQLLAWDKDIIGASTQYKEHDLLAANIAGSPRLPRYMGHELDGAEFTLTSLTDALDRDEPIRKVAGIPMGFTLLKMSAIDAVSRAVSARDADVYGLLAEHGALTEADMIKELHESDRIRKMWGPPFQHKNAYLPGRQRGVISTTDMSFCGTARSIGLDVWLDAQLSLQMEHIGDMNFGVIPPVEEAT